MRFLIAITLTATMLSGQAFAHSGGTDASGCHMNHTTGVYHCH